MSRLDATRRQFIAAGASAAVPFFIKAEDKAGIRLPIIGEGEHTYECIHDWGQLPANIRYGNTHGVCEDAQGNIYVHHTVHKTSQSDDSIVVFDAKGRFVRSWGRQFKSGAHGLHLRKEGNTDYLYICDQQHSIVTKRTLKFEEVWTIGYPTESKPYQRGPGVQGIPYRPTNVAIAPSGDVYVGDGYGSSYITVYDQNARYKFTFGGKGQGTGKELGSLNTPHGLMVDLRSSTPVLLVADRTNNRIQRFALSGDAIDIVEGTNLPCHFHERQGVVVVPVELRRSTMSP